MAEKYITLSENKQVKIADLDPRLQLLVTKASQMKSGTDIESRSRTHTAKMLLSGVQAYLDVNGMDSEDNLMSFIKNCAVEEIVKLKLSPEIIPFLRNELGIEITDEDIKTAG